MHTADYYLVVYLIEISYQAMKHRKTWRNCIHIFLSDRNQGKKSPYHMFKTIQPSKEETLWGQ